jgi:hypothetical protein
MSVSLERCVLSGLITCPEQSYRYAVTEFDLEASIVRRHWPTSGCLFVLAQQPPVGQGLLIHEVPRSHTTNHIR